jgi:hypothetical protein
VVLDVGGFFYAGEFVEGLHLVYTVVTVFSRWSCDGCGVVRLYMLFAPVLEVVGGAVAVWS